ncbi:serum response factor-binding protein 1 [Engystomops pustulosus]|uniref:serum response factor-binding protein 1 n=1 Tax=Engystomops pustulosus TaxID=76066 RepID=UPI003AFA7DD2
MTANPPVLNLNNEVVKMRADVKKVKALTIRKLIRHIQMLKNRKGTEEQVLQNKRRGERIYDEIQCIRKLKPDEVTKYALGNEVVFDKVFNNPSSSVEIRAVTRLATQPLIKEKIASIKEAVKAFKKARRNQAEPGVKPQQPSLPSKPEKKEKREAIKAFKKAMKNRAKSGVKSKKSSLPSKPVKSVAENQSNPGKAKQKRKKEESELENNKMDRSAEEIEDNASNVKGSDSCDAERDSVTTPQAQAPHSGKAKQMRKKEESELENNNSMDRSSEEMEDNESDGSDSCDVESDHVTTPQVQASQAVLQAASSSEKDIVPSISKRQIKQSIPDKVAMQNRLKKKNEHHIPDKNEVQSKIEKRTTDKDLMENKSKKKEQSKPAQETKPSVPSKNTGNKTQKVPDQKVLPDSESDSSDLEDSDAEPKEYFDDSTEERFLKQTPGCGDSNSDSEDNFFIGKVKRMKKKSSKSDGQEKKDKAESTVSGPGENRGYSGPKKPRMESVFFTSLGETKPKFSYNKRESKFPPVRNNRAGNKPAFSQGNTSSWKPQPVKTSSWKPQPVKTSSWKPQPVKTSSWKPQPVKASAVPQKSKVQEQTLHPSWEASKKRKEQSQLAVFQGKKIVFDD